MTDAELKSYYADLLILQYRGLEKARATIEAIVGPLIMEQLPTQVENGFNIETAVGAQLDILLKYVGGQRSVVTAIGVVTLDDDESRLLLKFAIVRNYSNGTLASIQDLIFRFFGTDVLVFDYQNMRISYMADSDVFTSNLFLAIEALGLLPRPMGVRKAVSVWHPDLDVFFGFRTYKLPAWNAEPFNSYVDNEADWLFLSYNNYAGLLYTITTEADEALTQEDGSLLYA